jgi:hypothetical protein
MYAARSTPVAALTVALLALSACATAGATLNSGVGDATLEHPPYYAGASVAADPGARVAHLPVAYQRGASQAPIFDPKAGAGTPVAAFVAELNAYLDSLAATTPLGVAPAGTAPDVRFGCDTDASGDCAERDPNTALGRAGTTMQLAVGRPSASWIAEAAAAMDRAGATSALVVTLEVGQYLPKQKGLRGSKEVELGTGYTASLPWLTSVETPVSVLQLTGARVGRDGKAIRIGAEGILARRTSLGISAIDGQALITEQDVERARTLRRDDLPGQPLAWRVAMRNLVEQLTGKR